MDAVGAIMIPVVLFEIAVVVVMVVVYKTMAAEENEVRTRETGRHAHDDH